jgi:TolB protein
MITPLKPPSNDQREALIKEARARRRRRWLAGAGVVAVLAAVVNIAFAVAGGSGGALTRVAARAPVVNARAFSGHGELAFVSRGALYVLDGAKGKLVRVAAAEEQPEAPVFSPAGRWLAFGLSHRRVGIAHANGTAPRALAARGYPRWLPNGSLLVGRRIYRIAHSGTAVRVGRAPSGLVAWAEDGSRYAFVVNHLVRQKYGSFHGVELLRVAHSLNGPQTTWYRVPTRFTSSSGYTSPAIGQIVVLPHRQGLLFWLDPDHSASLAADGLALYQLARPAATPRKLAVTVGSQVSLGGSSGFAVGAGGDRYAWRTKHAVACSTGSRCATVPAATGHLSVEPAWSPRGSVLAYVVARSSRSNNFFQPTIRRWYGTRHLWLLTKGTRPRVVPESTGAADPTWSRDGGSVLFVANDSLWLLPRLDGHPIRVAGPLFRPSSWPSYYGQVDWIDKFSWRSQP